MLRNFLFVMAGLVIFISGGIIGPNIWGLFETSFDNISANKADTNIVAEKSIEKTSVVEAKPSLSIKSLALTDVKDEESQVNLTDVTFSFSYIELFSRIFKDSFVYSDYKKIEGWFFNYNYNGIAEYFEKIYLEGVKLQAQKEAEIEKNPVKSFKSTVAQGDSLLVIFGKYTDIKSAYKLIDAIKSDVKSKDFKVTALKLNQSYSLVYHSGEKVIKKFIYNISDTKTLILDNSGNKPQASIKKIEYDKKLAFVKGTIKENPYKTIKDLNEDPDRLAVTLLSMFKWDIDFNSDIKKGDEFSVLVEKLYHEGEFKGYGRTIGGTFTNDGKILESFLYYDSNKREKFYNKKGENMQKFFLRTPLDVIRITSGYTHRRRHPIYGTYRPHLGIDYGAPSGTRIFAIADGVVTYMGWRGGFGKHITIRHASGLESMYSHLRSYARGLRKGSSVKQGKVIGYVGSTGVSTGPHLDFRLKQNGKYINPRKSINPRAAAISKVHQRGYEARKKLIREFMDGTRSLDSYDPKMLDIPGKKS